MERYPWLLFSAGLHLLISRLALFRTWGPFSFSFFFSPAFLFFYFGSSEIPAEQSFRA